MYTANDDMVMTEFSFADINDNDVVEDVIEDEVDMDLEDDGEEIPDWMRGDEVEEEEEDDTSDLSMKDFDSSFSLLPDEYEIAFGDTKVSKKELAQVVAARESITRTNTALESFVSNLVGKEDTVQAVLAVGKTETEKQLERVNEILDNPDDYTGNLKDVISAKRTLTARMKELETEGQKAMEAINAQREQATALAIQNTAKKITGGMETLRSVADFAKSRGIGHEILMNHVSPELVALLQDAQRYQVAMEKNKARVNGTAKSKAPTSKAATKKTSEARAAANKKTAILNRMRAGKHVDPSESFLLIQD